MQWQGWCPYGVCPCWVQPQEEFVLQQFTYRAGLTCACQLLQLSAAICMLLMSLEWLGPATAVIKAPLDVGCRVVVVGD